MARIKWEETPLLYHPARPPCPHCKSKRKALPATGGKDQGDGSILRLLVCRDCSRPFRIVEEFTEIGNCEQDTF